MHLSAKLYIPESDMHPSLAKQITLFSLLRGIKNLEKKKKKKWQNPYPNPEPRKTEKHKKNKKAEPMSQYLAWGQYFCFFGFSRKNQKKQKGRTYVLVFGMGSVLLVFCFFWFFEVQPKKKKKAEPMSQYLAWGQYFWFFGFSR